MPAYDLLVGFARRIFRVREREEALAAKEAEQQSLAEAQEKEAADLRRRAAVVASSMKKAGRAVPDRLEALAEDRDIPLDEDGFPGAWAIPLDTEPQALRERLESTTNLELRAAFQETRDAVRLIEDDDDLREKYQNGLTVIEADAAERGFDLEIGRQDLRKVKDLKKAMRHTDQFAPPIKVIRKSGVPVQTRT